MTNFGQTLRRLRKSKGLKQHELAEKLGIGKNTISNYETGYSTPPSATLRLIADFFSVSVAELLEDRPRMQEFFTSSAPDIKSIPVYAALPANPNLVAPLLHHLDLPAAFIGDGEFFGLKITGDRMERAALPDGSIAIIRKQEFADDGEIVAVALDDMPVFTGRIFRDGDLVTLVCESSNAMYRPVVVNTKEQSFKILGKVIKAIQAIQ